MYHIKRDKQGQYYFLSVGKKGFYYEVNSRQSQGQSKKSGAINGVIMEMKNCDGQYSIIIDHTGKSLKMIEVWHHQDDVYKKTDPKPLSGVDEKEIDFVKKGKRK
jgi:hypothetical protein